MADAPAAEPVRFYADEDQRLPDTVAKQLLALRKQLVESNGTGYAGDWGDYKHRSGYIAGLDHALTICEEAKKELSGD